MIWAYLHSQNLFSEFLKIFNISPNWRTNQPTNQPTDQLTGQPTEAQWVETQKKVAKSQNNECPSKWLKFCV